MHKSIIKMKNGWEHRGYIWSFRPEEGWLSLVGTPDIKIYFKDILSAVTKNVRISINKIGDQDELERARKNGWKE